MPNEALQNNTHAPIVGRCGALDGQVNTISFNIPPEIFQSVENPKAEKTRHVTEPILKSKLEQEVIPAQLNCPECPLRDRCRASLQKNLVYYIGQNKIGITPKTVNLTVDIR